MTSDADDRLILVARIGAAHGIKGEVRVKSFTEDPFDLDAYGPLTSEKGDSVTLLDLRPIKGEGMLIARIQGISDRTSAEKLNGTELFIPRSALPEPDEDDFYYEDLIGLPAFDEDGKKVGTVTGVFDFGAGDLIEITPDKAKAFLLAFTQENVPDIDLTEGRIVISPPTMIEAEREAAGETAEDEDRSA